MSAVSSLPKLLPAGTPAIPGTLPSPARRAWQTPLHSLQGQICKLSEIWNYEGERGTLGAKARAIDLRFI